MFNVTILKMKDILKFIIGTCAILLIIISTTKYCKRQKDKDGYKKANIKLNFASSNLYTKCIDDTISAATNNKAKEENKEFEKENNYFEKIIETEISSVKALKNKEKIEISNQENIENSIKEEKELASTEYVSTQVVTQNPIAEKYNTQYDNVKIKNETSYNLTEDILNPNINIDNKNIVIFHTHSCESYTPSEQYNYEQTGNYRTTDLNFSVTRVGKELTDYLKEYNLNVIHDTSYHDYPSYTGSYTRSLQTVENILKSTASDIIIDLHRDAIGSNADYAPTVKIGEEYAAQIMFVIGTDEGGLLHPNWNQNLKFAIKIQQKAENMYPGLFKPIMVTKSRYNQHTGKYANIIEVGATGNTLEQCLNSMKYLSNVINETLNEN